MASRARTKKKERITAVLAAIVVVFCLFIEWGSRIPGSPIPSWKQIYEYLQLAPENVTPEGQLEVHFIDVGNADCTLLRQGEDAMLIDAGERGDGENIVRYLRAHGVQKLKLVIATHAHADHIGGMVDVIRAFPVEQFLFAPMPASATPTSSTYIRMLEALDEKKVPVVEAKPGTVYELGTARLQVLAPLEDSDNMNNMSVVTRLTFGQRSFLFAGDAEAPVEKLLLRSPYTLKADVMKASHHGSSTSNTEAFVKKVDPQFAVIPCGRNNKYGHPHQEVLDLYEKMRITFYRNDVYGSVVFTSDGKDLSVKTEKE